MLDLPLPRAERVRPRGRARVVGHLEVALLRPHQRDVLATDHPAEPVALHLGHVPDQAEQRQGRWWHRLAPELLIRQAVALHRERRAMVVEECAQHDPLVADEGRVDSFGGHRGSSCVSAAWAYAWRASGCGLTLLASGAAGRSS